MAVRSAFLDTELYEYKGDEHRVALDLFRKPSELIVSAPRADLVPTWTIPEVAFAGRSNVGKSSLINSLLGQKGLVRTSKTPGRTQELNFFSVGGKKGSEPELSVVDMPGYGFAQAPKAYVDNWHTLVGSYAETSSNLKRIFLLIDARRGPSELDTDFMEFLQEFGVGFQIVLTKIDTVSVAQWSDQLAQLETVATSQLNFHPVVLSCSSKESIGIRELQLEILAAVWNR